MEDKGNLTQQGDINESRLKCIASLLNTSTSNKDILIQAQLIFRDIQQFLDFYKYHNILLPQNFYTNFVNFVKETKIVDIDLYSKSTIIEQFNKIISEIINSRQYYILDFLFQNIFTIILDSQFDKKLISNIDFGYEDYIYLGGSILSGYSYYSSIRLDENCNLITRYVYDNEYDEAIINREKEIFNSNISKFIIHSIKEIPDGSLIIPYFPLEGLYMFNFLVFSEINLTISDKLTILIEIAQGLLDLHTHDHYHGNFCGESVYLSSSKDAYIGRLAYDKTLEKNFTRLPGCVYTRPPEFWTDLKNQQNDLRKEQLGDIYSFGVVMHSIFSEVNPEIRFTGMFHAERFKIISGNNYCQFLLGNAVGNEIFQNEKYAKAKEIIEKCMKPNPNDRYHNMNEVINDIKNMPLFIENKKEIEFRCERAKPSKDYRCAFSDVVESFYRGSKKAESVLEFVLKNIPHDIKISSNDEIIKIFCDVLDKKE